MHPKPDERIEARAITPTPISSAIVFLTKSSAFFNKPSYFVQVRQLTLPGNLEHLETRADQLKPCVLCECEQKREEVEIPSRPTRVVILPPETQSSRLIENAMPESPRSVSPAPRSRRSGSPRYKGNNPRASNTSAATQKKWLSE